jgi:hypothetical protein
MSAARCLGGFSLQHAEGGSAITVETSVNPQTLPLPHQRGILSVITIFRQLLRVPIMAAVMALLRSRGSR